MCVNRFILLSVGNLVQFIQIRFMKNIAELVYFRWINANFVLVLYLAYY
jgi:hypothetical protein